MKILFIAPRYHTNQLPIVRELLRNNISVEYAVHYRGATEDYSELEPVVLKKSVALRFKIWFDRLIGKKRNEEYYGLRYNASIIDLIKVIRCSKPDLIVLRGKSITERKACVISFLLGIPSVLYNQEPYYKPPVKSKIKRVLKKIYNFFVPRVRYTPVQVSNYEMLEKKGSLIVPPHTYFIPFAGEENPEADSRCYLADGIVNFLMVGKFREYKTHRLLVDALAGIATKDGYRLTFVGQCSNQEEVVYFNDLKEYVFSKGLGENISFVTNVEPSKMKDYYLNNDVLILPTKNEAASISVLEAMHYGMSVISTSRNGTASYIEPGKSGYVFTTCDVLSLREKLMFYLNDPESVERMGRGALDAAKNNSSGRAYLTALKNMLDKEFPNLAEKIMNIDKIG